MSQSRERRLFSAFLTALGLSLIVVAAALALGLQIYRTQQALVHEDAQALLLVQRLRYRIERQVSTERAFLLAGFRSLRSKLALDPEIHQILEDLRAHVAGPQERRWVAEVSREVDLYERDLEVLEKDGLERGSFEPFERALASRRREIFGPLERLNEFASAEFNSAMAEATKSGRRSLILGAFLGAGLMAALMAIAGVVRRSLIEIEGAKADLEGQVAARTLRLERVVRQLETFGYSVAHDLRAPARAVAAYSELILREQPAMPDPARAHLRRVMDAGTRLRLMLDGLLILSRLAQEGLSYEEVDLSAAARKILDELSAQEPGRAVETRVAPGLEARADPRLLQVLMQNLIENAWKFTGRRERARIEVGAESREGRPVFFVKDNGEGFEPAHAKKLFEPFHRLPGAAGFPGLGIGLASAARVVEAHGGRLWAEGEPGRGAAFFFTLEGPP